MSTFLKIDKIIKEYKNFKLEINDLLIDSYGLVGLIGDNGSGKTTFLEILSGKIKAKYIEVEGFEANKIYGNFNVYKNTFYLTNTTKFYGKLKTIMEDFVLLFKGFNFENFNNSIKIFNLDINKKFTYLSQGQKVQFLLSIAQSLPVEILYLDEVTNGLDTASREIVYEMIAKMAKTKTVIFSTHILDKDMNYFNRILFMERGNIIFDINSKQSIIKENNEYKIIENTVETEERKYDIIEYYKEISSRKAKEVINE